MTRQMAIMKHVRFGVNDRGIVGLTFQTYLSEGSAASQFLGEEKALEFIKEYLVKDVSKLNGKPCWAECDGNIVRLLSPCAI